MEAKDVTMGDSKETKKEPLQVPVDPKTFNLAEFIRGYKGHIKVQRLLFIADHAKDLKKEAFQLAREGLQFKFSRGKKLL